MVEPILPRAPHGATMRNRTRYRTTEEQARQGAEYGRGNARNVNPLRTKGTLLNLFNRTWKSGELPRSWRTAVLVPVLKKGKLATAAESWRPISLISVISKTMKRMVNARLSHYLKQSACLDESQSGFQRHRTTVDQLVQFTQSVINAWQAKSHTVAVFVDLEKAYDRLWRTGLAVRLQ
ncbi:RNA-directed DNA polymerase from mobile element jockey [Plakobranchus ocellatus]|uniref:RNA-directed DNA polymerase from mobile element jockey n=1 Tax=Plakobranchus ocellatus TaxID=259542 RepID=A0AAV4ABD2_9GAST|nr:RNA-directed DNA polymerase from mobile element jockey [Plakobranchus ocellatus]